MRAQFGENYRTLLGHFRHELGHYYWDRLVRDDPDWLARYRAVFGDETVDYEQALKNHYANGSPRGLADAATSRPMRPAIPGRTGPRAGRTTCTSPTRWRWCESLNMKLGQLDTIDHNTLPQSDAGGSAQNGGGGNGDVSFDTILERWLVLSEASNSINRCMGLPDLYPFVISVEAGNKLRFVYELLAAKQGAGVSPQDGENAQIPAQA